MALLCKYVWQVGKKISCFVACTTFVVRYIIYIILNIMVY